MIFGEGADDRHAKLDEAVVEHRRHAARLEHHSRAGRCGMEEDITNDRFEDADELVGEPGVCEPDKRPIVSEAVE